MNLSPLRFRVEQNKKECPRNPRISRYQPPSPHSFTIDSKTEEPAFRIILIIISGNQGKRTESSCNSGRSRGAQQVLRERCQSQVESNGICNIFLFPNHMDTTPHKKVQTKNNPFTLEVLNHPCKSSVANLSSSRRGENFFYHPKKKCNFAVFQALIPKSKLLTNLETYEWRYLTDFPIVRTGFVSVKTSNASSPQIIQLEVLIEHCPLRLSNISRLSVGKALFLLKECTVGFERLYNRFGGFEITERMISINQKGFCRVWVNENFSLNAFIKNDWKQSKMVERIVSLIQGHIADSKVALKLFPVLSGCTTFLSILKAIDKFSNVSKIMVPNKILPALLDSNLSKTRSPYLAQKRTQEFSMGPVRYSIQPNAGKLVTSNSKEDLLTNARSSRNFKPTPIEIRRFKSEDKMKKLNLLKASEETTHTYNQLDAKMSSNLGSLISSPKNANLLEIKDREKRQKWIEESSFFMGMEDECPEVKQKKEKKELTHSEAFHFDSSRMPEDVGRKFSINLMKTRSQNDSPPKRTYDPIPKQDSRYISEFTSILNDDSESRLSHSPRNCTMDEEDEGAREHSKNIIKNNGWSHSFTEFFSTPKQLRESIHAGEEENIVNRDFKLEKLGNIGRREVAMSILPEECEQLY